MKLKLALPKGRLLSSTSNVLQKAGLKLSDYSEKSRSYRPQCSDFPDLLTKIFKVGWNCKIDIGKSGLFVFDSR